MYPPSPHLNTHQIYQLPWHIFTGWWTYWPQHRDNAVSQSGTDRQHYPCIEVICTLSTHLTWQISWHNRLNICCVNWFVMSGVLRGYIQLQCRDNVVCLSLTDWKRFPYIDASKERHFTKLSSGHNLNYWGLTPFIRLGNWSKQLLDGCSSSPT